MFRELIQDIQHDCYVLFLRFRLHTIRCRFDYWIDRKRLGDFNVQVEAWKQEGFWREWVDDDRD